MQEQEIEHIFSKISTVRLDTYKKHFSLENPKDIYTAYCWGVMWIYDFRPRL